MIENIDGAPEQVLDEAGRTLDEIEAALQRLENADYGRCAVCGDLLDDSELELNPFVICCGAHRD